MLTTCMLLHCRATIRTHVHTCTCALKKCKSHVLGTVWTRERRSDADSICISLSVVCHGKAPQTRRSTYWQEPETWDTGHSYASHGGWRPQSWKARKWGWGDGGRPGPTLCLVSSALGFCIVGGAASMVHWFSCADHAIGLFSPGLGMWAG